MLSPNRETHIFFRLLEQRNFDQAAKLFAQYEAKIVPQCVARRPTTASDKDEHRHVLYASIAQTGSRAVCEGGWPVLLAVLAAMPHAANRAAGGGTATVKDSILERAGILFTEAYARAQELYIRFARAKGDAELERAVLRAMPPLLASPPKRVFPASRPQFAVSFADSEEACTHAPDAALRAFEAAAEQPCEAKDPEPLQSTAVAYFTLLRAVVAAYCRCIRQGGEGAERCTGELMAILNGAAQEDKDAVRQQKGTESEQLELLADPRTAKQEALIWRVPELAEVAELCAHTQQQQATQQQPSPQKERKKQKAQAAVARRAGEFDAFRIARRQVAAHRAAMINCAAAEEKTTARERSAAAAEQTAAAKQSSTSSSNGTSVGTPFVVTCESIAHYVRAWFERDLVVAVSQETWSAKTSALLPTGVTAYVSAVSCLAATVQCECEGADWAQAYAADVVRAFVVDPLSRALRASVTAIVKPSADVVVAAAKQGKVALQQAVTKQKMRCIAPVSALAQALALVHEHLPFPLLAAATQEQPAAMQAGDEKRQASMRTQSMRVVSPPPLLSQPLPQAASEQGKGSASSLAEMFSDANALRTSAQKQQSPASQTAKRKAEAQKEDKQEKGKRRAAQDEKSSKRSSSSNSSALRATVRELIAALEDVLPLHKASSAGFTKEVLRALYRIDDFLSMMP